MDTDTGDEDCDDAYMTDDFVEETADDTSLAEYFFGYNDNIEGCEVPVAVNEDSGIMLKQHLLSLSFLAAH